MASAIFKPSRIISVAILLGAAAWIASGVLSPDAKEEPPAATGTPPAVPLQKVSVVTTTPAEHKRTVTLSCTTEADQSSVAVARANGLIVELKVDRGDAVKAGDTIAVLSDEGRQAMVLQAQALLDQRIAEYDANKALIDKGNAPKNQLPALEAAVAAAKAALASAQAEADKSIIRSPISGVVDDVPVQLGQAIQPGQQIASVLDPDPMLAVGSVSERDRNTLKLDQNADVRFIDGSHKTGTVSYIGLSADKATRTYPVQVHMANPDAAVGDGITCEMVVTTDPIEAVSIPRSALVFSDAGQLGVRVVDDKNTVNFIPVDIVDDGVNVLWLTGIEKPTRVIVVGQDFVKDGDQVEAVAATDSGAVEPPATAAAEPPA